MKFTRDTIEFALLIRTLEIEQRNVIFILRLYLFAGLRGPTRRAWSRT